MKRSGKAVWILLAGFLLTSVILAGNSAFYRIIGPSETRITEILPDGTLAWSNSVPESGTVQIQRSFNLQDPDAWQDYVQAEVSGEFTTGYLFSLQPPEGMVLIPGGVNRGINPLEAGESHGEQYPADYDLSVEPFYVDTNLVTKALWEKVIVWGITNGYDFSAGTGKGEQYPIHFVTWYNVVKWCNARSEMEDRSPVYTVNGSIYRTGVADNVVQTSVAGYRLPTDAEWEYAARGGLRNQRFPWGNTISHLYANYVSANFYRNYDVGPTRGYHPAYNDGSEYYPSPVGSFAPNGYGLYDVAGNKWEWCFDLSGPDHRSIRGGGWYNTADLCRVGYRTSHHLTHITAPIGFRTVLPLLGEEPRIPALNGDLDFGEVVVDSTVSRDLLIANEGNANLTVIGVSLPEGFGGNWSGVIAAGATQIVSVTFAPLAAQSYAGDVVVSSDATSGANTLSVTGVGVPEVRILALSGELDFGEVVVDSTVSRDLLIANEGYANLTVIGVSLPEGFGGNWSGVIAAGATQIVSITFAPLAAQSYAGDVVISSDATSGANTLSVTGVGVADDITEDLYLVIDLSVGSDATSYPVSYMSAPPAGGWTDEYKTTKLVLRRIPAGTFMMGSPSDELGRFSDETQRAVTLTKDYYMGVFEVTQRQWELVMGNWPSYFNNVEYRDARPVEQVTYHEIRENADSNSAISPNWPQSSAVGASSFVGKLRARTGLATLDLPTEAQWERAARAGTGTALNSGQNLTNTESCPNMSEVGRYRYNHPGGQSGSSSVSTDGGTAKVGSYLPNAWGLYDMHGNVFEWCLDGWEAYHAATTDPVGAASGADRVGRGGSWGHIARGCRSAVRNINFPDGRNSGRGFRLSGTLPSSSVEHTLTVVSGSGGGAYVVGTAVAVTADAAPAGQVFLHWSGDPSDADLGASFAAASSATTITMPGHDVTLTAAYQPESTVPAGMVLIPGGTNEGTNPLADGEYRYPDYYPEIYSLVVESFYMDQQTVTKALWDEVYNWAIDNGYSFDNAGQGKDTNHPVYQVKWYDVVKWSNARSEMEGRPAVYTVNGAVYRAGRRDNVVQTSAVGHRLPTDAEWEYAARGGLSGKRFPWGNTITHSNANYNSRSSFSYDVSLTRGSHPAYDDGSYVHTSPVGSFPANGYGLYDMVGNVQEWIFDRHPVFSSWRVLRGGGWVTFADRCRVGYRTGEGPSTENRYGFRTVLPLDLSGARILVLSGDLDFGEVVVDTAVSRDLLIANEGHTNLTVSGVSLPEGFSGDWAGVIAAGATQAVSITFTPLAEETYTGNVMVSTDATSGANTRPVTGVGVAGDIVDLYLVIDLSDGPDATSYPVSYRHAPPAGGWTDEYKTTKLVMRRIPAGTFMMGSPSDELGRFSGETQRAVTLTKDDYMGIFQITQKQWERVMGNWPSYFNNVEYRDARPVEQVTYHEIRENADSNSAISPNWPASSSAGASSFVGKLRAKTGLTGLDLPTEAQWERAARAGTTTSLNSGKNITTASWDSPCPHVAELGRYGYNHPGGYSGNPSVSTNGGTAKVGASLPNAWGFYDMHGNVWEWCLDWYENYHAGMTDPAGAASGFNRLRRGGDWFGRSPRFYRSAHRNYLNPGTRDISNGFRLSRTLP